MVPAAVVWLSYGVSSSYVLADAIDKGKKAGEVSVSLPRKPPLQSTPPCGSVHSLACGKVTVGKSTWDSPIPTTSPRAVPTQVLDMDESTPIPIWGTVQNLTLLWSVPVLHFPLPGPASYPLSTGFPASVPSGLSASCA